MDTPTTTVNRSSPLTQSRKMLRLILAGLTSPLLTWAVIAFWVILPLWLLYATIIRTIRQPAAFPTTIQEVSQLEQKQLERAQTRYHASQQHKPDVYGRLPSLLIR